MEASTDETHRVTARHWLVLAVATFVAASGSAFVAGIAFLLPHLHSVEGLTLARAGLLVSMPSIGMALALVPWGWLVDRTGEKLVLTAGSTLAAVALGASLFAASFPVLAALLLLAGAATASGNSASGRLVVGWFPAHRRGLAMGIRQMSQPAGAAVAALSMPLLAQSHGLGAALGVPLALAAVSAVAALVVVTDPPRETGAAGAGPTPSGDSDGDAGTRRADRRAANPYRTSGRLHRIHGVSVLLVLPQGLMQAFLLAWLMLGHGWSAAAAGSVVTVSQALGAAARVAAGLVSDRMASRMRPIRGVAVSVSAALAALAAAEALGAPGAVAVALAVVATVLSVSDNGLAFTAVAEHAGPRWSGRALGVQNTAQFLALSAGTPIMAALIERSGYWPVFAAAAVIAAVAVPLVPREG